MRVVRTCEDGEIVLAERDHAMWLSQQLGDQLSTERDRNRGFGLAVIGPCRRSADAGIGQGSVGDESAEPKHDDKDGDKKAAAHDARLRPQARAHVTEMARTKATIAVTESPKITSRITRVRSPAG